MKLGKQKKKVTIFKNDKFLLIGRIKSEDNITEMLILIKTANDIIYLGKLINNEITHEWLEVNDQAVAIIGESNSSEMHYIKTIFSIKDKSFISDYQDNLLARFEELFGIKSNEEKEKIITKKLN